MSFALIGTRTAAGLERTGIVPGVKGDAVKHSGIVIGLLGLAAGACVTPGRGEPLRGASGPIGRATQDVAFDHNCPKDRIRGIRTADATLDLDVCGQVRRYKAVATGLTYPEFTWWDVTSLYPPSALPAPLPPAP